MAEVVELLVVPQVAVVEAVEALSSLLPTQLPMLELYRLWVVLVEQAEVELEEGLKRTIDWWRNR